METPGIRYFDAHAHYNDRRFEEEFEGGGRGALLKAHAEGVERICNVGSSVSSSEESIRLAEEFPFVIAAVGIHPSDAQEIPASECDRALSRIEALCSHEKVRAVGEIGFDYHWDGTDKERQTYFFEAQMEIALRASLPVVIHSRDAAGDTFDMISRHPENLLGSRHLQEREQGEGIRGGRRVTDAHDRDGLPLSSSGPAPGRDQLFGVSPPYLRSRRGCERDLPRRSRRADFPKRGAIFRALNSVLSDRQ